MSVRDYFYRFMALFVEGVYKGDLSCLYRHIDYMNKEQYHE